MISIQTLKPTHALDHFDCGHTELNDWLKKIARQHQKKRLSSTFVILDDAQPDTILGYYALTICTVNGVDLPTEINKKLPRNIPGIKLGRLATHVLFQGNKRYRIGETLLLDAMNRSKTISDNASGYALFVDAINDKAAQFYERYGFIRFPDQPLMLFFPMDSM